MTSNHLDDHNDNLQALDDQDDYQHASHGPNDDNLQAVDDQDDYQHPLDEQRGRVKVPRRTYTLWPRIGPYTPASRSFLSDFHNDFDGIHHLTSSFG